VGYGVAERSSDEADFDREGAAVAYVTIGWTLSDHVLIGAEFNLWSRTAESERSNIDATVNIYNASIALVFYPSSTAGFFVKSGGGASLIDLEIERFNTRLTTDLGTGLGYIVGVGYDIPVGSIWITPAVNFWGGVLGDLEFHDTTLFTDWKQNVLDFTIGVKFH
jgi:hypothetical protein